jgi:hypothetical protein
MSAIGFRPGQRIKFPYPFDNLIAYLVSVRYENRIPIIGYRDGNGGYGEIRNIDLLDCTHDTGYSRCSPELNIPLIECTDTIPNPPYQTVTFDKKTKEVLNEAGEFIGHGELIDGVLTVKLKKH